VCNDSNISHIHDRWPLWGKELMRALD